MECTITGSVNHASVSGSQRDQCFHRFEFTELVFTELVFLEARETNVFTDLSSTAIFAITTHYET